jgi:hypothetical protein
MSEQKTAVAVLPTELVTIDPDTYVAQVYEPFETRLTNALVASKGVTYVITTKEGMEVAKANRKLFRDIRIELEKKRVESKEPITKIGKLIDSRAKEITAKVEPEEARFDKDIKAEEQRIEDEKAAKIKAEAERNAQIQRDIDGIKNMPLSAMGMDSASIQLVIDGLAGMTPTAEQFGERFVEAEMTVKATVSQLTTMLEGKKAQEQLAAMQEAQRVAAEAQAKIDAEEKAAAEAKAREEQAAQAAALKAQQEEIERQRAEMAAQQKAINDRQAALEQAEADARAKLEAEAKAKADAEASAQREADAVEARRKAVQLAEQARPNTPPEAKNGMAAVAQPAAVSRMVPAVSVSRPSDDEMIDVLALHFRVHESKVIEWMLDMDLNAASDRMAKDFA